MWGIYQRWLDRDRSSFQSKADWHLDIRTKLPFADQSCAFVFCEHFLEHLDFPGETRQFLAECYRVLKNRGVVRIIVPDAGKFLQFYAAGNNSFFRKISMDDLVSPMEIINRIFYGVPFGEHRYSYDLEALKNILQVVGFRDVLLLECGKGNIASELDRREPYRVLESLYVEATKRDMYMETT